MSGNLRVCQKFSRAKSYPEIAPEISGTRKYPSLSPEISGSNFPVYIRARVDRPVRPVHPPRALILSLLRKSPILPFLAAGGSFEGFSRASGICFSSSRASFPSARFTQCPPVTPLISNLGRNLFSFNLADLGGCWLFPLVELLH